MIMLALFKSADSIYSKWLNTLCDAHNKHKHLQANFPHFFLMCLSWVSTGFK